MKTVAGLGTSLWKMRSPLTCSLFSVDVRTKSMIARISDFRKSNGIRKTLFGKCHHGMILKKNVRNRKKTIKPRKNLHGSLVFLYLLTHYKFDVKIEKTDGSQIGIIEGGLSS